uniref:von Willebrand factor-like n=1 Tax=Petromyzon marinus TaxID=7757 RepID=A0AAJ7T7J8_PETMA|nr:von Willebrand factor-like [Petromyzon marinus]
MTVDIDNSTCSSCLEGLFCYKGACVPLYDCPCVVNGAAYEHGSIWNELCKTCMCIDGNVECIMQTCLVTSQEGCSVGEYYVLEADSCCGICRPCCNNSQFNCHSSGCQCIPNSWVCDGTDDCTGGEDEDNCVTSTLVYSTSSPPVTTTGEITTVIITTPQPTTYTTEHTFSTSQPPVGTTTRWSTTTSPPEGCVYMGVFYPVNGSWPSGVNGCGQCYCRSQDTVKCDYSNCEQTCIAASDQLKTFDDQQYQIDYCSHVLSKDCANGTFEIVYVLKCSGDGNNCSPAVHIATSDTVLVLESINYVIVNDVSYTAAQIQIIGLHINALNISYVTDSQILVSSSLGFKVIWKNGYETQVVVDESLKGRVCGLCGNANGNKMDDFVFRNGTAAANISDFIKSWEVGTNLCSKPNTTCLESKEAIEICKAIFSPVFLECQGWVDANLYYNLCLTDVCKCIDANASISAASQCKCPSFASYTQQCMNKGKCINWRVPVNCPVNCNNNMVYKECASGCPKTCSNINGQPQNNCAIPLTSGCMCPDDKVWNGNTCVGIDSCNPCVCTGYGDPHYITFDGKYYPFMGNCSYVLVNDTLSNDLLIYATNEYCTASTTMTCTKSVTALYKGNNVTLLLNKYINANGALLKLPPSRVIGSVIFVELVGLIEVLTIPEIGLKLTFTPSNMAFRIELPPSIWWNRTEGLCGSCDGNPKDDFITNNGSLVKDSDEFGYSWAISPDNKTTCYPQPPHQPCNTTDCCVNGAPVNICNVIYTTAFKACHPLVNPDVYYNSCRFDVCKLGGNQSACASLEEYSKQCLKVGICINWRNSSLCPYECPAPYQYQPCAPTCPKTCDNYENYQPSNCDRIEGCMCPDNYVYYNGTCVAPSRCPKCIGNDGTAYAPGDKWYPNGNKCTECECSTMAPGGSYSALCKAYSCRFENVTCADGQKKHSVLDSNGCCMTDICLPCEVSDCINPPPIPTCDVGEELVLQEVKECCKKYKCQCVPSSCQNEVPVCKADYILKVINPSACCKIYNCVCPEVCSNSSQPPTDIPFGYKVINLNEGGCCPVYSIVCDKDICKSVPPPVCNPPKILNVTVGSCCNKTECVCPSCDHVVVPVCGQYEVLQTTAGPCCNSYSCICDSSKCPVYNISCQSVNQMVVAGSVVPCCGPIPVCQCKHSCAPSNCPEGSLSVVKGQDACNCSIYECRQRQCLFDGQIYPVDSTWGVDVCTVCFCEEVDQNFRIRCEVESCAPCGLGLANSPIAGTCCGECVEVNCTTYDNGDIKMYQPGEQWNPDFDSCTTCICVESLGQVSEVCNTIRCDPVPDDCKPENVVQDGCCLKCLTHNEPNMTCQPVLVNGKSTPISAEGCVSHEYVDVMECAGTCSATTLYSAETDTFDRRCGCCAPAQTEKRSVQLFCPNGSQKTHSYTYVQSCSCQYSQCPE